MRYIMIDEDRLEEIIKPCLLGFAQPSECKPGQMMLKSNSNVDDVVRCITGSIKASANVLPDEPTDSNQLDMKFG